MQQISSEIRKRLIGYWKRKPSIRFIIKTQTEIGFDDGGFITTFTQNEQFIDITELILEEKEWQEVLVGLPPNNVGTTIGTVCGVRDLGEY